MKILKSESFDYNDDKSLVDFVNKNSISKNNIQQIVTNNYQIILFYWETVTVEIPNNKRDDKEYMYLQREVNHVYSERNGM